MAEYAEARGQDEARSRPEVYLSRKALCGALATGLAYCLFIGALLGALHRPDDGEPVRAQRPIEYRTPIPVDEEMPTPTALIEELTPEATQTKTVKAQLAPVPTPEVEAASFAAQLTEAQLDAVFDMAGVPLTWRGDMKLIASCETRWQPSAVGDGGNSLGLFQLWHGWFLPNENPFDPVTNTVVAVRVRQTRGRYGGGGGWTCADRLGIP